MSSLIHAMPIIIANLVIGVLCVFCVKMLEREVRKENRRHGKHHHQH